jgi:hypothetical protein
LFDQYTDELHQFFRQVFIREDVRENMLDYWASMLVGGNESRTFATHRPHGLKRQIKSDYVIITFDGRLLYADVKVKEHPQTSCDAKESEPLLLMKRVVRIRCGTPVL